MPFLPFSPSPQYKDQMLNVDMGPSLWIPLSIVKGNQVSNFLANAMQSEWGRKLYGRTLIWQMASGIYKVGAGVGVGVGRDGTGGKMGGRERSGHLVSRGVSKMSSTGRWFAACVRGARVRVWRGGVGRGREEVRPRAHIADGQRPAALRGRCGSIWERRERRS